MIRKLKPKRKFEEIIENQYVVEKMIGEGGFCVVFKCINKFNNQHVAVKRMDKSKPLYRKFNKPEAMERLNQLMYREADVMRALNHENIMKILDFIDNGQHIYIVLEFAEGGELYSRLLQVGRFKEYYAALITYQVISGLDYMHKAGFVHRDIKAENVLFRDKNTCKVMITDFGLSKHFSHTLHTNCGTLVYSAPELLKNKTSRKGYSNKVDNWAAGVLLYLLLSGYLPFDDPQFNEGRITKKICGMNPSFSKSPWNLIRKDSYPLIAGLLDKDPKKRIELEKAVESSFMRFHIHGEDDEKHETPKEEAPIVRKRKLPACQKIRIAILSISIAFEIFNILTEDL